MSWGKVNLVTRPDMSDLYRCSDCGYQKAYKTLIRDAICPKCGGSRKRTKTNLWGYWTEGDTEPLPCNHCNQKAIVCPKQGNRNSYLWKLKRRRNEKLMVCPNGCLENGRISKLRRKRNVCK